MNSRWPSIKVIEHVTSHVSSCGPPRPAARHRQFPSPGDQRTGTRNPLLQDSAVLQLFQCDSSLVLLQLSSSSPELESLSSSSFSKSLQCTLLASVNMLLAFVTHQTHIKTYCWITIGHKVINNANTFKQLLLPPCLFKGSFIVHILVTCCCLKANWDFSFF